MKIVQTFWSGENTDRRNYGWLSPKHHFLSWILSSNQLRKFYKNIELITDSHGYELLINRLKLPFTKVRVELDSLNTYPSDLWALAKIKAYSLQDEPFLHIDSDAFIFEAFSEEFLQSDLVCQNAEILSPYYPESWIKISAQLPYIPDALQGIGKKEIEAYNMGIFGGHNLEFIKNYTDQVFSFVDQNAAFWNSSSTSKEDLFNFNIFFEQKLFNEPTSR